MSGDPIQKPDFRSDILVSIWLDDVKALEGYLKERDPNEIDFSTPALCVAKSLQRTQCVNLLKAYKADETFAESYDLYQSYRLFFEEDTNVKVEKKLANKTTVTVSMDNSHQIPFPSYSNHLIHEGLKSYALKNPIQSSKANYKLLIELFEFSKNNFFATTIFNANSFLVRILNGETTLLNSGWSGTGLSHTIGMIFHKDLLIVGDGLDEKIVIYKYQKNKLSSEIISSLLSCPNSDEQNRLVRLIVGDNKPLARLSQRTQKHHNCTVYSILSSMLGLWYLFDIEKGLSHQEARHQAQTHLKNFNDFMKENILNKIKRVDSTRTLISKAKPHENNPKTLIPEAKHYENNPEALISKTKPYENNPKATNYSSHLFGILFSLSAYSILAFYTGFFISLPIVGVVIGCGYAFGVILATLRSNFMSSKTDIFLKAHKDFKGTRIKSLADAENDALLAGINAGKSYISYFSACAKPACYKHASYFYVGMELSKENHIKLK